jgi:hypothetical protein
MQLVRPSSGFPLWDKITTQAFRFKYVGIESVAGCCQAYASTFMALGRAQNIFFTFLDAKS